MSEAAVDLPALDGLDPLGFLAALGVLRLLHLGGVEARLAFDPVLATARLTGVPDIDSVVDELVAQFEALPKGGLMVGMPADLIPEKPGSKGSDPARLTPSAFAAVAASCDDEAARGWVRALWTDLATKQDGPGRRDRLVEEAPCAFTPFSAATGQQTLRSTFEKPTEAVGAAPRQRFEEALRSWRRVDGVTGENLDRRAVREAAEQPEGKATRMGVPGATWLALSALPFFPMGGDGVEARTRRWYRLRFRDGRRRLAFSWPIWRTPLDVDAVGALLAHGAIDRAAARAAAGYDEDLRLRAAAPAGRDRDRRRVAAGNDEDLRLRAELNALGVERVAIARRWVPSGASSAGILVPAGWWG